MRALEIDPPPDGAVGRVPYVYVDKLGRGTVRDGAIIWGMPAFQWTSDREDHHRFPLVKGSDCYGGMHNGYRFVPFYKENEWYALSIWAGHCRIYMPPEAARTLML